MSRALLARLPVLCRLGFFIVLGLVLALLGITPAPGLAQPAAPFDTLTTTETATVTATPPINGTSSTTATPLSVTPTVTGTPTLIPTIPRATATGTATPWPATATPVATQPPCAGWRYVDSPTVGMRLDAVAAVSGDVWAVGHTGNEAVTLHGAGDSWTVAVIPTVYPGYITLAGVTALAPNNVWIAGSYDFEGTGLSHIALAVTHWNGSSWTWESIPATHRSNYEELSGIAALNAGDIWAVGYSITEFTLPNQPRRTQTVVVHWDGSTWSLLPSPDAGSGLNSLLRVVALTTQDVWAVGVTSALDGPPQPLIEHWDGTAWTVVPGAGLGGDSGSLFGLAAAGADDLWAVGSRTGGAGPAQPLIEHWDGTAWTVVPGAPGVPAAGGSAVLNSVAAAGAGDIWAVGSSNAGNGDQPLIEHWAGNGWTVADSPALPVAGGLQAVAASESGPWAVGRYTPATDRLALIAHFACPTGLCALSFGDVAASDWAYNYVHWAFCQGIIGGYSDGTFRPGNPATRGQVAKMITLAAGWPLLNPATGHFPDVLPGSTFYEYIETGYSHGILSGYPDGTFRPGNSITRGQLTKLTVLARGYSLLNPPTGHFGDVPPGSTFYAYIETAAAQAIVGGYSDGSFRPAASATRAQFSKILYGAYATAAPRFQP